MSDSQAEARRFLESCRKVHPRDARDKYPQSYVDHEPIVTALAAAIEALDDVAVRWTGLTHHGAQKVRHALTMLRESVGQGRRVLT